MDALQCPRCPVRFRYASELRDHLEHDHPDFRARPTDAAEDLLEACHCHHRSHARGLNGPKDVDNAA
jgi:hypothetical protein